MPDSTTSQRVPLGKRQSRAEKPLSSRTSTTCGLRAHLSARKSRIAKLVLTAPNEFNAIWIENNYLDIICAAGPQLCGHGGGGALVEVAQEQTAELAPSRTTESPSSHFSESSQGANSG